MTLQPRTFGGVLRRLRIAAGLTLTDLASRIHYSKGQLSKVETGQKRPTAELARLCDVVLETGGELEALLRSPGPMAPAPAPGQGQPASATGQELGRRQVITAGAMGVLGLGAVPPDQDIAETGGETLLDVVRTLFDQFRLLGQSTPPEALLPALEGHIRLLRSLAGRTGSRTAMELVALAARYAEFAGWMAQEAGAERDALRWTEQAVELATASGDRHLSSYALVRRALVAYYRGDASATIDLAGGARSGSLPPRIRGLAAQRQAQGYAIAGDYNACMRALDTARELLEASARSEETPVLGTTNLRNPADMTIGWCLLDLGRPAEAAEVLDRECARIPSQALRTQARYGIRQALAHALSGELEVACEVTGRLLLTTELVGSATIATDVRRLARTLSRHSRHPAYLAIAPQLATCLATARGADKR
ncbi:helix-turn-helix transcriptional regulator [Streptomyces sp. NPDC003036]|uniref:helix-turn-helix domain-containing protein n=1 Tax=Streptomyces sp. NPDC003036 TaxID=3154442 RepID=UPI0033A9EC96